MRCSPIRLRALLAFILPISSCGASLTSALTPARASDNLPSKPLGGPVGSLNKSVQPKITPNKVVQSKVVQPKTIQPTYKANAAPKPAIDGERLGERLGGKPSPDNQPPAGTPYYPSTTYANATEETVVPGQPPAALGPAPYNLGSIKKVQVGNEVIPQAPLRVGNLDILVPITSQIDTLGATLTKADLRNVPGGTAGPTDAQFFQINLPTGSPIVLTIGKSAVWVGNQEQPLRCAPLVIGNDIYLPIFSIAPLLGAAARLNDAGTLVLTPTIQSVELFPIKDTVAITIKASAPVPPGLAKIVATKGGPNSAPKVYVDFPGYSMGFDAGNSTIERLVAPGTGDVLRARAGMPSKFPDSTRIVLDLKRPLSATTQNLPDPNLFALVLVENGEEPPPIPQETFEVPIPGGGPQSPAPPLVKNKSLSGLTIVVDAGHGGHDIGARGRKSYEKNHTLDIARRLRTALQERGANVIMPRDTDVFISLQGRVNFANQQKADLFVSVHINSSVRSSSTGTETFYYTAISQNLARSVQNELYKATGRPSRGISQARFYVIRHTRMPAILTESAFISNPKEEALLLDPKYRERLARGIAQGVDKYIKTYGRPRRLD